jgi:nicotinate dehydrogenase subunit B
MREGVSRDGSCLLPVFSYTHFARSTARDVQALYAFVMTRMGVVAPDRVIRPADGLAALKACP